MGLKRLNAHNSRPLSSGAVETIQIPVYDRIQDVVLRFDGTETEIRSEVGTIRLAINGTDIINCTAAELYDVYEMLGVKVFDATGIDGAISLNLGRLIYNQPAVRDQFGWGEVGVTNIQISVTALTLTNVSEVTAYTVRDTARNANGAAVKEALGAHVRLIAYPQVYNAAGEHTADTLPRDLNTAYLAVMASDGSAGTISAGRCKVNDLNIYDEIPSDVNELHVASQGYTQVSGYYTYLFADGGLNSRLPMNGVTDLRFATTFSVAPGAAGYRMLALTAVDFPAAIPA